jgi:hypothetical protein
VHIPGYDWRRDRCSSFSTGELGAAAALRRQAGQRQPVAPTGIGTKGSSMHQQCPSGLQVIGAWQFWQRVSITYIIGHRATCGDVVSPARPGWRRADSFGLGAAKRVA